MWSFIICILQKILYDDYVKMIHGISNGSVGKSKE
jgi:hypothetical protein